MFLVVILRDRSDAVLQSLQTNEMPKEMLTLRDVLKRLLTSVVDVIEKLVYEYIEGDLSHLSSSLITQVKSAPVHNMFSEQTLALADHQLIKSPNLKVGFIDGKVMAKKKHVSKK